MYAALGICALVLLLLNLLNVLRLRLRLRKAQREAAQIRHEAATARQQTEDAEVKLQTILQAMEELVAVGENMAHFAQANAVALAISKTAREHWKSYAIALEVLCECCAEDDGTGAENARDVIQHEREILRFLGEYDD